MDSKEIRKINLRALIKAHGGNSAAFAEKVETSPVYLSQIFSKKTKAEIGDRLARKIEARCGKPRGWLDRLEHAGTPTEAEPDQAMKDFAALPPGLKEHVARYISDLRRYADALPPFILKALRPPSDLPSYRQWERELEDDMHKKLNGVAKN